MKTIKFKLQASIGGLVLVIVSLAVIYFPMQQRARAIQSFETELQFMGDSLAIAIGVALEGESLDGIKLASEYVRGDNDSASVVISTPDGSVFAAYPPEAGDAFTNAGGNAVEGMVSYQASVKVKDATEPTHTITISKSLDRLNSQMRREQLKILVLGLIVLLCAHAIVRMIAETYAAPIEELSHAVTEVTEGRLGIHVDLAGHEEFSQLATGFNNMVNSLRLLSANVKDGLAEFDEVARGLESAANGIAEDLSRQQAASTTISEASKSVSETAIEVDVEGTALLQSISASSSVLQEMDVVTRSVAQNMVTLIAALDGASSGSTQLATSVANINSRMGTLSERASNADELLKQMSTAIRNIDGSAARCGELSSEVRDEATRGAKVVEATIESARAAKGCFAEIESGVERLEARIGEVSEILEIISSIADQTNLLSLNAAILAAQSGEAGSGFSVVAGEIKVLSQQTAESATSVAALLAAIDEETKLTKNAVETGGEAVEVGFDRSLEAGCSLQSITDKAALSAERMSEIVDLASAQANYAEEVEEAVNAFRQLADQTSEASQEHMLVGARISNDLEQIRELGMQTQGATESQLASSVQINEAVKDVLQQMEQIAQASTSQVDQSKSMTSALDTFTQLAHDGERRAEACRDMVTTLLDRAHRLQQAINRFDS